MPGHPNKAVLALLAPAQKRPFRAFFSPPPGRHRGGGGRLMAMAARHLVGSNSARWPRVGHAHRMAVGAHGRPLWAAWPRGCGSACTTGTARSSWTPCPKATAAALPLSRCPAAGAPRPSLAKAPVGTLGAKFKRPTQPARLCCLTPGKDIQCVPDRRLVCDLSSTSLFWSFGEKCRNLF